MEGVDGMIEYHTQDDGSLMLDENGEPIPKTICICAAREPMECVCGAWDDVDLDTWYGDDY